METKTAATIAILLTIALLVPSIPAANVTYPQEYYTLGMMTDQIISRLSPDFGGSTVPSVAIPSTVSALELRRQTILMEKQNELLAEQNEILRSMAPKQADRRLDKNGCYENETGQDPNDLVMHITCPPGVKPSVYAFNGSTINWSPLYDPAP
jgi:hypothetical protein